MGIFKPDRLALIIFAYWLVFSLNLFQPLAGFLIKNCRSFRHLKPEETAAFQIKGELYKFIIFCKAHLPEGARCLFYNSEAKYAGDSNLFEWEREVASYYFYPIRIYILSYNALWEILPGVSFIIVYGDEKASFPGFEPLAKYNEGSFILKRKNK